MTVKYDFACLRDNALYWVNCCVQKVNFDFSRRQSLSSFYPSEAALIYTEGGSGEKRPCFNLLEIHPHPQERRALKVRLSKTLSNRYNSHDFLLNKQAVLYTKKSAHCINPLIFPWNTPGLRYTLHVMCSLP